MAEDVTEGRVPLSAQIGIGCLTAFAGFFGGGMVAVLIAKIVGFFTKCQAVDGTPACNWHWYALVGGAIGFVGLPALSIWRLNGRRS